MTTDFASTVRARLALDVSVRVEFRRTEGGCNALYHAATDPRCQFAGTGGAVCSFVTRLRRDCGHALDAECFEEMVE